MWGEEGKESSKFLDIVRVQDDLIFKSCRTYIMSLVVKKRGRVRDMLREYRNS